MVFDGQKGAKKKKEGEKEKKEYKKGERLASISMMNN